MQGRLLSLGCLVALLAGCTEAPTPPALSVQPPSDTAKRFDPAKSGTITGEVVWRGEIPVVPPFRSVSEPFTDQPPPPLLDWPNPNAPIIDPATRAVASAIVFLRKVAPARSRPWDHPTPRVEVRGQRVHIMQGVNDRPIGFVRAGDSVEIVSHDKLFHSLQGRGAAFFACPLEVGGEAGTRLLPTPGLVELRSGAGYFWMRGYLFVAYHPYFAHTDARGRFTFTDVPAGEYDLVAWHPNWRVVESYRNPDSTRVQQVTFGAPLQSSRPIVVEAKKTAEAKLELSVR